MPLAGPDIFPTLAQEPYQSKTLLKPCQNLLAFPSSAHIKWDCKRKNARCVEVRVGERDTCGPTFLPNGWCKETCLLRNITRDQGAFVHLPRGFVRKNSDYRVDVANEAKSKLVLHNLFQQFLVAISSKKYSPKTRGADNHYHLKKYPARGPKQCVRGRFQETKE